ncbi:cell division suppressor protein YneA [Bacillus sp. AK128]
MKIKTMNLSFYIAFIMSITLFFICAYLTSDQRVEEQFVQIEVLENETIWELAERYAERHSLTPSEFVSWVEKNNQINSNFIHAGSSIYIPIEIENQKDSIILVADGSQSR